MNHFYASYRPKSIELCHTRAIMKLQLPLDLTRYVTTFMETRQKNLKNLLQLKKETRNISSQYVNNMISETNEQQIDQKHNSKNSTKIDKNVRKDPQHFQRNLHKIRSFILVPKTE